LENDINISDNESPPSLRENNYEAINDGENCLSPLPLQIIDSDDDVSNDASDESRPYEIEEMWMDVDLSSICLH